MNDWYDVDATEDFNHPAPNFAELKSACIGNYREKTDNFINLIKSGFSGLNCNSNILTMAEPLSTEVVTEEDLIKNAQNSSVRNVPLTLFIERFEKLRDKHIDALERYFEDSSKIVGIEEKKLLSNIEESIERVDNCFSITQRFLPQNLSGIQEYIEKAMKHPEGSLDRQIHMNLAALKTASEESGTKISLDSATNVMDSEIARFTKPDKNIGDTSFVKKHMENNLLASKGGA